MADYTRSYRKGRFVVTRNSTLGEDIKAVGDIPNQLVKSTIQALIEASPASVRQRKAKLNKETKRQGG